MAVIKAQKIPRKPKNPQNILISFCYYFPRYSFAEARRMPFRRIYAMLKVVRKEQAKQKIDLLRIVTAPHTKKGAGVKKLLEEFNGILNE